MGSFECVGVMHEQDAKTGEVWTHQQRYIPQIKDIPIDKKAVVPDEQPADDDTKQLFMSLVGALAWLILTMPCICIYVAFLQRQTQAPTIGHVRKANRLLRWIRSHKKRLGVWFKRLKPPLRVVTLSDNAFKAQDYQGLVMRGCVILLAELGGQQYAENSVVKLLKPGQNVNCQVLDWYARKHSRVVRSTYAAELLSLLDAVGRGNIITTAIDEIWSGATSAAKLLERHSQGRRCIEHDAIVDAKAVWDGVTAQCPKTPADKPLFLHALAMHEYLESGWVDRLWWADTLAMLADGLTKGSVEREALIAVCERGTWAIVGEAPVYKQLRKTDPVSMFVYVDWCGSKPFIRTSIIGPWRVS